MLEDLIEFIGNTISTFTSCLSTNPYIYKSLFLMQFFAIFLIIIYI